MTAHIHALHSSDFQRVPAPDPQRRILILAMVALIRDQMRNSVLVGGTEARACLQALTTSDLALVVTDGGLSTIEMMGIRARTTGSAHALLYAWINEAHRRIEGVA